MHVRSILIGKEEGLRGRDGRMRNYKEYVEGAWSRDRGYYYKLFFISRKSIKSRADRPVVMLSFGTCDNSSPALCCSVPFF